MQENRGFFKIYMVDTGLLSARMRMRKDLVYSEDARRSLDLGALVENYVAQCLIAQGHDLHCWASKGKAEIGFVIEGDSAAGIPVEVKSSRNVRSKSLSVYREKYKPAYAIRLSEKNFGFEGGIKSVPLYAAFCEMGHEQPGHARVPRRNPQTQVPRGVKETGDNE